MIIRKMKSYTRAQEILKIQQTAIKSLSITEPMINAIDTIAACYATSRKIITTGIGKAGIIAQKMSATLASLGLSSFFIHPAESLHGDIGRITSIDLLIVFSNSGTTGEIIQMIKQLDILYPQTNEIIYIGKAVQPAFRASIIVQYPDLPESCVISSVPSTTTSIMLVIADVLSITAAEQSGLNSEWFRLRHPGGAIGQHFKTQTEKN